MPARNAKTYSFTTLAGATATRPLPENPNRVSLMIQNTGANLGNVRFGAPVQAPGSDLAFAPGAIVKWDFPETCPLESVNLFSTASTTWCIVEGTDPMRANGGRP